MGRSIHVLTGALFAGLVGATLAVFPPAATAAQAAEIVAPTAAHTCPTCQRPFGQCTCPAFVVPPRKV